MPRRSQNGQTNNTVPEHIQDDLFLEPMMGTPLAIYIEKDVPDRDTIVELVTVRVSSFDRILQQTPVISSIESWRNRLAWL
jgi:hypothetical protein